MISRALPRKVQRIAPAMALVLVTGCGQVSVARDAGRAARPEATLQYSRAWRPSDLSFAANAPALAVSDGEGRVDIWNTANWTRLRSFAIGAHGYEVREYRAFALSPDGRVLAVNGLGGKVSLRDVVTGAVTATLDGSVGRPFSVAWSRDGRRIAAGGETAAVWDTASRRGVRRFAAGGAVAFSPDGERLAVAGDSATIYDIATGRKIRSFTDKAGAQGPVAFSPDGKWLATGGDDPTWTPGPLPKDEDGNTFAPSEAFYAHQMKVKVWDVRTGKRQWMLPGHSYTDGGTSTLAFLPDSRHLFSAGDGYAAIWDVRSGKALHTWDSWGPAAISPDGRFVAVTKDVLRIFDARTGRRVFTPHAAPRTVTALAFSADGRTLATGEGPGPAAGDGTGLRLWDVSRGRLVRALPGPPPDLCGVGFLPDGSVYSNSINATWIWNPRTGKRLRTLKGPAEKDDVGMVELRWQLLLPGGKETINEGGGPFHGIYQVRDAATHQVRQTLGRGRTWLANVAFSSDGRYLAAPISGPGGGAVVSDLRTGKEVSHLQGKDVIEPMLAFAPDGGRVAGLIAGAVRMPDGVWLSENRLALWDTASGRRLQLATLPSVPVKGLAFSPDGKTLAAGVGGNVRIFEGQTLAPLDTLKQGEDPVASLAFSPDGMRLAVGDDGGRIRLWDAPARKLLVTMVGFPMRDGSKVSPDWFAETPDGLYAWPNSAAPLIRFREDGKLYPAAAFEMTLRRMDLLEG